MEFRLGPFFFKIHRPEPIKLKRGEQIIVSFWKWWPPGWHLKLISCDENLDVHVMVLR